ncbi:hypothetical protein M2132_001826 [Dysgonomonas sp. PH5-45]|uniref:hypothetical protein n=1 Tax=unclassified Dysgonomonas TaxID=2630389 RepID=UPI0024739743|nr:MULTISPECIES: hypothetical protein [unclassified Dysgonomonas]MDH6355483.1 hypothetical protein [Dysgonomonas sp. PH5-45]MDH6388379.1 hypothetical protein [Dysgonomonas sp. PH5-37]
MGGLITYLKPVYDPMVVLGYVFFIDIAAGILVDLIRNDDRLRIRKLLIALAFLALYFTIIASTYIIGEHLGDADESLYIVKTLTYTFTYFYVSNTIRNLRLLAPNNKPLAFLDYWLGLQVIKRLPDLAKFLGITNKQKDDDRND